MAVSRFLAEQGQTVRLGISFEDQNLQLYDPYAIAKVEILAEDDTLLATKTGADIVHNGVGIYYVDWAIPGAADLGKHYDKWYYTPVTGHDEVSAKLEFYVYLAGTFLQTDSYLTVSEAKARCLVGTALSDTDIQYLIRVAMTIIDRCAGQHFLPVSKSLDVDGTGEGYLVLPKALLQLTGLENLDSPSMAFTPADYRMKGTWLFHKDWKTGAVIPAHLACYNGGYFPRGHRNIRVTGIWGLYEACPVDIQHATCLLLRYAGQWDTVYGPIISKYARESVDGWSYALREVFKQATLNRSTGHPAVDVIIQNHRRFDRGMAVI